jgi:Tol biopolymer transport system component
MENQINTGNQNSQQVGENTFSGPTQLPEKYKLNYWMISTFVLLATLIAFLFWFFTGNRQNDDFIQNKISNSGSESTVISTPTETTNTQIENNPKLAVFMREGMIYVKNFNNNQERKVSRTIKVESPNLSPNGKYITYFSIVHGFGGFPRGDVYIADVDGRFEYKLGNTNESGSKTTWSKDGNLLGLILFANENPSSSGFYAEALLYDAMLQKDIARTRISIDVDNWNYQYDFNFDCANLETEYVAFCNEFAGVARDKKSRPKYGYNADQYRNSIYKKEGYKFIKSYKAKEDLVVLEYYTGDPTNPESQWGIGGGVFVPGYDEGTTQTYTVLLNEKTNTVILEILNAVDTQFLF